MTGRSPSRRRACQTSLAAGRAVASKEQVKHEFEFALKNIKPIDALLIGMYQKFGDQIGENAALISELCQELSGS